MAVAVGVVTAKFGSTSAAERELIERRLELREERREQREERLEERRKRLEERQEGR